MKLTASSGMEVGPQPHHIAVGGGPNHDGRTPIMQPLLPSCHLASLDAEGYLSVERSAEGIAAVVFERLLW